AYARASPESRLRARMVLISFIDGFSEPRHLPQARALPSAVAIPRVSGTSGFLGSSGKPGHLPACAPWSRRNERRTHRGAHATLLEEQAHPDRQRLPVIQTNRLRKTLLFGARAVLQTREGNDSCCRGSHKKISAEGCE